MQTQVSYFSRKIRFQTWFPIPPSKIASFSMRILKLPLSPAFLSAPCHIKAKHQLPFTIILILFLLLFLFLLYFTLQYCIGFAIH